jgi:hypothetical protein
MLQLLLAAQLAITSPALPLSPEDAIRVLRASGSIVDRTDAAPVDLPGVLPLPFVVRSRPGDGPFGRFPVYAAPSLQCCGSLTIRLSRPPRLSIRPSFEAVRLSRMSRRSVRLVR